MTRRAVVIGGSIAGLATAVGLARKGWHTTVLERDEPCPTDDGDKAFDVWNRRSVPQFLQPHLFSARSRTLLLEHIPEAVQSLIESGIEEVNLYKLLAPEDTWVPEDDLFTGLQTRRPAFELAIRQVAENEPGVEMRSPSTVAGLRFAPASGDGVPVVDGVRLDTGEELAADAVIDAGGRRSKVPKWLADAGVQVPEDVQDCYSTYYARYFRQHPDATLPRLMLFGVRGEIDKIRYLAGPGDTRTFSIWMTLPPNDDDYAMLRHTWAWDAVAQQVAALAPWVDPANAEPLHDVQVMAGHMNVRRHYVVDGKPLVHGLLPVGDSLCTTNPFYGWGASMALTYAFGAVEALTSSDADHDRARATLAYDALVRNEADGVYEESAAADRLWRYTVTGDPIPPEDEAAMERQQLLQAVFAGGMHDIVLGRALLRRMNLLESPRATLDDPEVVEHARHTQEIVAAKAGRKRGPDREELRAIIDAARP